MTFEEFQATRTRCEDLGKALRDCVWDNDPAPGSGYLYKGDLLIEDVKDHWAEETKIRGKYQLLIGHMVHISNDLAELERRLYDFAISEKNSEPA